jgi:N-acetyl-gamma-glutamyl-phosphate reductase
LKLLARHPHFEVALVTSRENAGKRVREVMDVDLDVAFEATEAHAAVERYIDVWVLALPNGYSEPWVDGISRAQGGRNESAIVDLSTDHRFDSRWVYGLPEFHRSKILGHKRVSNPGCYATGAQLALFPILDLLDGPAHVFGISGYSGAGTTPSPRNDPKVLADNVVPYSLLGHAHESEIRWQLGHKVCFSPHVAPFFRGIVLTIQVALKKPMAKDELLARYRSRYQYEPLVTLQDEIPLPRDAAHKHGVTIGGIVCEPAESRAVVVATLDNLLKGAATQCLQNMNLVCGLDELAGIRHLID